MPEAKSTRLDPAGMKKAFGTVGHTRLDTDHDKEKEAKPDGDEGGGLGAKISRGIKKRLGG